MIPMTGIAAMARNRTIGNAGKIPWHYSADFKWFREYTLNKCILVGRSTYENLPKLLNRKILVLSNSQSFSYYDWQYDSSVSTITLENLENIKLPVIVAGVNFCASALLNPPSAGIVSKFSTILFNVNFFVFGTVLINFFLFLVVYKYRKSFAFHPMF